MNGQAQAVMLLLLGGAVLRATITDTHLRYVKPQLGPFLVAAGAVLLVTGAMTLFYDLRRERRRERALADADDTADATATADDTDTDTDTADVDASATAVQVGTADGHGHGRHGPRVGWLLLLPVLGLLLVTPPALGSYAAGQAGTVLSGDAGADYPPLPAGEPVRISVLEYASRAVFERGASLRGRGVELTGFLTPGPDGSPYLTRMILSCCAADGRPIKVGMLGNTPAGRPADTWVRVSGTYSERTGTDPINGETIPYLEVETWEQIDPPKQQYE